MATNPKASTPGPKALTLNLELLTPEALAQNHTNGQVPPEDTHRQAGQ